jgi:hypothetical protein
MLAHGCAALLGIALDHWCASRHSAAIGSPCPHWPLYEILATMLCYRCALAVVLQISMVCTGAVRVAHLLPSSCWTVPDWRVLGLLSSSMPQGRVAESRAPVSSAPCGLVRR